MTAETRLHHIAKGVTACGNGDEKDYIHGTPDMIKPTALADKKQHRNAAVFLGAEGWWQWWWCAWVGREALC